MKKTLSVLLTGAMLAGSFSAVSAATIKDFMTAQGKVGTYSYDVDANIEVKKSADTTYVDGPISTTVESAGDASFDYKATLYMDSVREKFTELAGKAEAKIAKDGGSDAASLRAELDAAAVTGEFTIKITNTDGMILPDEIKKSGSLKGFSTAASSAFEETERTYNSNVMTIKIKVKDGITKTTLASNLNTYLPNLELSCEGVTVDDFGTYTISGDVTGSVKIGDFVTINYKAVQKDSGDLKETVTVSKKSDTSSSTGRVPSSSAGSVTKPEVTNCEITIEVDEEGTTHTISKGATFNPYDLDAPKKDNHLFGGWVYKDTNEPIDPNKAYTENTTIAATWIPTGVNISFVINDEEADVNTKKTNSVNVSADDIAVADDGTTIKVENITPVVPANMEFSGWFIDADCTVAADSLMVVTEDTVFYAKVTKRAPRDIMNKEIAYIAGYPDGTVKPENDITREEVATIFFRLLTDEVRSEVLTSENDFTDVDASRWSNEAISTMKNYGLINGYSDGTFKPASAITRAEFVTIVARFCEIGEGAESTFTDVSGHWAESYIAIASEMGWINGYSDNTFRPDQYITRAEAITVINNMLDREFSEEYLESCEKQWADNTIGSWYYDDVIEATNDHIIAE